MSSQNFFSKTKSQNPSSMQFPGQPKEFPHDASQSIRNVSDMETGPNTKLEKQGLVHIGTGVNVKGTFEDCDTVEIHGSLDGEIQTRELIIHEDGYLTGMATCQIARILGGLDGEIEATELLQIQATGRLDGKVNYTRLMIEDGGLITGEVCPSTKPIQQKAATLTNKTLDVTPAKTSDQDITTGSFVVK
jgi:cytoskeletal protein CcmA (bactofilin family)